MVALFGGVFSAGLLAPARRPLRHVCCTYVVCVLSPLICRRPDSAPCQIFPGEDRVALCALGFCLERNRSLSLQREAMSDSHALDDGVAPDTPVCVYFGFFCVLRSFGSAAVSGVSFHVFAHSDI